MYVTTRVEMSTSAAGCSISQIIWFPFCPTVCACVCVYRTWAKTIPGHVGFFSSEGSDTSINIPIVALRNVDDSYPPQKKSFMMLKYMHDNYLDKYEWFMRADDDVYINSEKLESFLRSLNSSEAIFLGQTGMGARDELGKLALEPGENFCMGGPGVIMSREVLRRMVPHIRECIQEMYTTHEDVEVGRCVRRFAGVQCVWSYETWLCHRPADEITGVHRLQYWAPSRFALSLSSSVPLSLSLSAGVPRL
ncbi:chondroitin sulfate synthase 3 isoform X3 [Channa argus]|uniref:chondroitin sulfate synthase 3 isoform X3 n=1 Tax=Channa argus TaxID=215402 RepID=UPI00352135D8